MENTICIDFGTRNSSVYYYKEGRLVHLDYDQGSYYLPSYVMYQQGQAVVGTAAMRSFGKDDCFVIGSVKRIIGLEYDEYLYCGDPNIFGCEVKRGDDGMPYFVIDEKGTLKSAVEVASELFKAMKEQASTRMNPDRTEFAFITVPADYSTPRVQAIRQAAEMAGLKVTKFIREPTAAALSWCIPNANTNRKGDKFLVYDFGGGTFDVSCIECVGDYQFKVLSTKGLQGVGGNAIDSYLVEAVINYMRKKGFPIINRLEREKLFLRKVREMRRKCEESKRVLINSTVYAQDESEYLKKNEGQAMIIDFSGMIPGGGDDDEETEVAITLPKFDSIIAPLIDQTIDCVKDLLNELHLQPSGIRYVLMIGNTSKIHQTKRKMVELFPRSEFPDVEKESCVSYGAALRMVSQYDKNSKVQVKDLLPCSYGMRFPSGVVLMVLKGDEIPCESITLNATMKGDDEYIITSIYQYDRNVDKLRDVHHPIVNVIDSKKVHNVKIHNPNPQPNEKKKLEFKLLVHEDGQLELTCLDMNKGEMLESSICPSLQIV
ncbi:chaperone Hsp70 [Blastocystis sp. ATCC 50177/Nand II]|uniref:Chaperone Hsp70 n=1 Tax=Blastocystis sp. subtype 1 (strain ATCC 50177 / NandII) TaxID=478820 RepID=A0A196S8Q8_BLAHN|nr:chaperone Hsp70 [Blastocystis sp. ATCC 50177/Nand II]